MLLDQQLSGAGERIRLSQLRLDRERADRQLHVS
jgi:hypothetical protein